MNPFATNPAASSSTAAATADRQGFPIAGIAATKAGGDLLNFDSWDYDSSLSSGSGSFSPAAAVVPEDVVDFRLDGRNNQYRVAPTTVPAPIVPQPRVAGSTSAFSVPVPVAHRTASIPPRTPLPIEQSSGQPPSPPQQQQPSPPHKDVTVLVSGTPFNLHPKLFAKMARLPWQLTSKEGKYSLTTSPDIFEILLNYLLFDILPDSNQLSTAELEELEPMALILELYPLEQHLTKRRGPVRGGKSGPGTSNDSHRQKKILPYECSCY